MTNSEKCNNQSCPIASDCKRFTTNSADLEWVPEYKFTIKKGKVECGHYLKK